MKMVNYYYDRMVSAYKQWQVALNADKPKAAKTHKSDYVNYKEMYEARMRAIGVEIEEV